MSNSAGSSERPARVHDDPVGTGILSTVITSAAAGSIAGAAAGLVWGGIGGRIAMRVAAMTSDDRVRGLISDDGFEIGRISAGTLFLLVVMTILGTIVGTGYGLARLILPGPVWVISAGVGAASAAIIGASVVSPDGIDFRLLGPLWLLVAMFVFIPGAWGVTVVVVTERLLRPGVLFPHAQKVVRARRSALAAGVLVWLALAGGTATGVLDLVRDVQELT